MNFINDWQLNITIIDRIRTMMQTLGLQAIYPKKNLSKPIPNFLSF